MMTHEARRKIATFAVFVLPVVLVKAATPLLGGAGPGAAEASSNVGAPVEPIPAAAALSWSAQQRAAASHVAFLRTQPFGPTPLYYDVTRRQPDTGGPITPPHLNPRDVVVQVIMTSPTGNVALIDGKPHRIGDPLGESGWMVSEINGAARSVTLKHPPTDRTVIVPVR